MDLFEYKGRNKRGEIMRGVVESPSPQAVAAWMTEAGIAPVHIKLQSEELDDQPEWLRTLQGIGAFTPRDLLLFTRQMGTMVKAGVPIMQALSGIQKSTANKALAKVLRDVRADLERGLELSTAMSHHPKFFNDYYVSMVRVGEGTGQLEDVFKRLHEQIAFEKYMNQKIKGALRYPTFVVIAISIALAILTIFVIPVFATIFTKFHATLPLLTRILLATSDFAVHYWWVVLAVVGGSIFAFRLYTATPNGRYAWDRLKLKFPIAGNIMNKAILARFCRSFSTASKSGIPLVMAFTLVSRVVDNAFFEERILLMCGGVERGESMLRVAQTAGIFSPLELQMIAVGEDTGDIDGMLDQLAEMYQEEVEFEVDRLGETIEPILLSLIGALVLILMLGVFLPMWQLGQAAMGKH